MSVNRIDQLVVIENGLLKSYILDDQAEWPVGRAAIGGIRMTVPTVSRQQGLFCNMNGIWFYIDGKAKNGTFLNGTMLKAGIGGRQKPVLLKHKDVLLFGAGQEPVIDSRVVWSLFLEKSYGDEWRAENTAGWRILQFTDENRSVSYKDPVMGTVVESEAGIAIYMGEITWLNGAIRVMS